MTTNHLRSSKWIWYHEWSRRGRIGGIEIGTYGKAQTDRSSGKHSVRPASNNFSIGMLEVDKRVVRKAPPGLDIFGLVPRKPAVIMYEF